jgi:hypothetical protein
MIRNNYCKNGLGVFTTLLLSLFFIPELSAFSSGAIDPGAPVSKGGKGTTIYVSKLGNNSDYDGSAGVSSAFFNADTSTTKAAINAGKNPALCNSDVVFQ